MDSCLFLRTPTMSSSGSPRKVSKQGKPIDHHNIQQLCTVSPMPMWDINVPWWKKQALRHGQVTRVNLPLLVRQSSIHVHMISGWFQIVFFVNPRTGGGIIHWWHIFRMWFPGKQCRPTRKSQPNRLTRTEFCAPEDFGLVFYPTIGKWKRKKPWELVYHIYIYYIHIL